MQYRICLPSLVVRVAWLLVSLSTGTTAPCSMCSMGESAGAGGGGGGGVSLFETTAPVSVDIPTRRAECEQQQQGEGQQGEGRMMYGDPSGPVLV